MSTHDRKSTHASTHAPLAERARTPARTVTHATGEIRGITRHASTHAPRTHTPRLEHARATPPLEGGLRACMVDAHAERCRR